jgi:HAD superfamily hydrolase (TIGR01509 family)
MPDAGQPVFAAVLFDMDGVLVDSEHRWNDIRRAFAAAHGRPWSDDDQRSVMGGNTRQWSRLMRDRLDLGQLSADQIRDEVVDGVVAAFRAGTVEVIAGAAETVRRLAAIVPVAIASSAHPAVIEAAIDALGLHGVFGAIASSDEVAHGKPEPDVYLLAASRLGVDPARCLVVEDSTNGVLAGKAAGAVVILVPNAAVPPAPGTEALADVTLARITEIDLEALAALVDGAPRPPPRLGFHRA